MLYVAILKKSYNFIIHISQFLGCVMGDVVPVLIWFT